MVKEMEWVESMVKGMEILTPLDHFEDLGQSLAMRMSLSIVWGNMKGS